MKITNRVILILILCISALTRFYSFFEIPFMHDEFSAIFRTNYSSFKEMIEYGVKPDGHPAGIQVFLYYWTAIAGKTEWLVKLPFAIMGLLSVLLVYRVARKWYNETVALLCAAFFTGIQYTVMYSQIARPYISGLFFSLAMVYFWSQLMHTPSKNFIRNGILYILTSALCAYNHHFSLLFAAIAGISGIFIINRKYLLRYILYGVIIFILYIPHLNIFITQLNTGGVGLWLAKPTPFFFYQYLYYIFNYSLLPVLVTAAIIVYGLVVAGSHPIRLRYHLLFFLWFMLPLLIGYFYSVYRNPVLQFSVLIFSFFPLLFILFGHIPERKPVINLVLVATILTATIYTLITERKHYRIFYNSPYAHMVADYEAINNTSHNLINVIDSHKKITRYYADKHHSDIDFTWFETFKNEAEFIRFLKEKQTTGKYLYFGALSSNKPNTIPIIKQYFPGVLQENNYYQGTTWLFSVDGDPEPPNVTLLDFESRVDEGWQAVIDEKMIGVEENEGNHFYKIDSLTEYSPTFSIPLRNIITHENNYIDLSIDIKNIDDVREVILVATLEADGEVHNFSGAGFDSFFDANMPQNEWFKVHHSVKLADIDIRSNRLWLKVFVWNKGKANFLIDNFTVHVRDGNPIIYGLYEKLPD